MIAYYTVIIIINSSKCFIIANYMVIIIINSTQCFMKTLYGYWLKTVNWQYSFVIKFSHYAWKYKTVIIKLI